MHWAQDLKCSSLETRPVCQKIWHICKNRNRNVFLIVNHDIKPHDNVTDLSCALVLDLCKKKDIDLFPYCLIIHIHLDSGWSLTSRLWRKKKTLFILVPFEVNGPEKLQTTDSSNLIGGSMGNLICIWELIALDGTHSLEPLLSNRAKWPNPCYVYVLGSFLCLDSLYLCVWKSNEEAGWPFSLHPRPKYVCY